MRARPGGGVLGDWRAGLGWRERIARSLALARFGASAGVRLAYWICSSRAGVRRSAGRARRPARSRTRGARTRRESLAARRRSAVGRASAAVGCRRAPSIRSSPNSPAAGGTAWRSTAQDQPCGRARAGVLGDLSGMRWHSWFRRRTSWEEHRRGRRSFHITALGAASALFRSRSRCNRCSRSSRSSMLTAERALAWLPGSEAVLGRRVGVARRSWPFVQVGSQECVGGGSGSDPAVARQAR